jgi:hypothetical protein
MSHDDVGSAAPCKPWRWIALIYEQHGDEIRVVAIEDGRTARFQ